MCFHIIFHCMEIITIIHSLADGHLDSLQFGAIRVSAPKNINTEVLAWAYACVCLDSVPRKQLLVSEFNCFSETDRQFQRAGPFHFPPTVQESPSFSMFSSFYSLAYYIGFQMSNRSCISVINLTWSWCLILFACCRIWFVNILHLFS